MMAPARRWDFFVSYAKDDRTWAEWIAWTLEAAGYRVLIQAWDMVPGTNWVFAVDEGMRRAERTIAVASAAYLESDWTRLEALGALYRDPLSRQRGLLVVRIEECRPEGPLGMITRIDVFGLPEADAHRVLLDGVRQAIRGRSKPESQGAFPGQGRKSRFPAGTAPNAGEHRISLALNVEGYRQLTPGDREKARARVLPVLLAALDRAGVRTSACVVVDRVDGLALILPVGLRASVAAALVGELHGGLASLGRASRGQSPLQCRVGLASGTVDLTSWTFEGSATTSARLLVSSGQVRVAAARSSLTPSAIIVADDMYQQAVAAMPEGFVRIVVSADTYGWILLIPGTVPESASLGTPVAGTALTAVAVAGFITGGLAAEAWQHLLDQQEGASRAETTAFVDDVHGDEHWRSTEHPGEDHGRDDQGTNTEDDSSPWGEDDQSSYGHGTTDDDGSDPYGGSDFQEADDLQDMDYGADYGDGP